MTRDIHVLHVDDDPAFRDLTAEFLERSDEPINVLSEPDPTSVLDRIEADPIDCVVSDYEMPERDGVALCRQVRSAHPDLPFFLFTSRGDDEIVEEALDAGATDYVQKSPGVTQYALLANRVTLAVSRRRALERVDRLEAEHAPPRDDTDRAEHPAANAKGHPRPADSSGSIRD